MLDSFFKNIISQQENKNLDDINIIGHGHSNGGYFVKWEDVSEGLVYVSEVCLGYNGMAANPAYDNFDVVNIE